MQEKRSPGERQRGGQRLRKDSLWERGGASSGIHGYVWKCLDCVGY